MTTVEIFDLGDEDKDDPKLIFKADFSFLPRVGEHLAQEIGDYFEYWQVKKVWHRQEGVDGAFQACVGVELDD